MMKKIQTLLPGNTEKIKVIMMMGQELLPEKSGKFNQIRKEAGPETAQEMISWATFLVFFF